MIAAYRAARRGLRGGHAPRFMLLLGYSMNDTQIALMKRVLKAIEHAGLVVITIATLVAGVHEVYSMAMAGKVTLADLLLLFLYLEVIAMVAVYLESGSLPVRMPLYIAIVALARYLALDIKELEVWKVLAVAGSIFVLVCSVLVLRYCRARFADSELDVRDKQDH
jgi:protein PsiE